jgi:phenylalanyl-tRNA synthetase alpha chain
MLHENVLTSTGVKLKTGFAGGMGIERIAMIKYGINDVRDLYSNDFRILTQFVK